NVDNGLQPEARELQGREMVTRGMPRSGYDGPAISLLEDPAPFLVHGLSRRVNDIRARRLSAAARESSCGLLLRVVRHGHSARRRCTPRGKRQAHGKARSLSGRAIDVDASSVLAHDGMR